MAGYIPHRWSISLGSYGGITLRLHVLLLLFLVLIVAYTFDGMREMGALTVGVLVASLMIHEIAHTVAAIRLGGEVHQIVLGPWGGGWAPRVPDEPEPQVFVAMAGPMVNLALAVISAGVLAVQGSNELPQLLNPLSPGGIMEGSWGVTALKLTLWINWTLLVLNLLPAYPFDGSPALRGMLWPLVGKQMARVITARVAMFLAVGIGLLAIFAHREDPHAIFPLWAPLVAMAILLFLSASHDLALANRLATLDSTPYEAQEEGDDLLDTGWLADESDEMVLVENRVETQREHREQQRQAQEAYEDARVDDILARLHTTGLDTLSPEDRAILDRASQRYRSRRPTQA